MRREALVYMLRNINYMNCGLHTFVLACGLFGTHAIHHSIEPTVITHNPLPNKSDPIQARNFDKSDLIQTHNQLLKTLLETFSLYDYINESFEADTTMP